MDAITHGLVLESRSKLEISGVSDVISFDEVTVILDTSCGRMTVSGEGLHIHTLSLENGKVTVEGRIDEISYEDDTTPKKKGLFARSGR